MQTLRARCSFLVILVLAALSAGAAQREQVSTRAELDLTPFESADRRTELLPVLAGDLVLVTSTLRLFAFDAGTAELRWSAGPPKGWDELERDARLRLYSGIDTRRLWIAPAAGERVAVVALQLPLSRRESEERHGLQITTPMPERRLFAFELGTGRPLWDHAPPPDWDGTNGSFAQRMSLCASPTIIGSCVLVPYVSDESSVDYHVASYELTTGELLWSTFVVRGQIERNMFGKARIEFAAAPLVVVPESGRVLAQTGLGLIAALDLATGKILWRSEYTPIELPKARSYTPPKREIVWRTTPPILAGNTVLSTPTDSRELLALDLEHGRLLWSVAISELSTLDPARGVADIDHLIGADENAIYLGGSRPSALTKRGGLRSTKAFERLWSVPVDLPETGRGQLWDEGLYLPRPVECLVLGRQSGRSTGTYVMNGARGLLVTDEALFALADDGLKRIER